MTDLPQALPNPCGDCPWRRVAMPGWLGPMDPDEWVELAMGEEPIACHETIKDAVEGEGDWNHPKMKQCTGAAIFRRNVCKSPRNPEDAAHSVVADREAVFSNRVEFLDYHRPNYDRYVAPGSPEHPAFLSAPEFDNPCDGCCEVEAEWICPQCRQVYCNPCIDDEGSKCPMCQVDPGWEALDNDDDDFDYDEIDIDDDL